MDPFATWFPLIIAVFWALWGWRAIKSGKANNGVGPNVRRAFQPFLYWMFVALYFFAAASALAIAAIGLIRTDGS